jgi:hypothetical protein
VQRAILEIAVIPFDVRLANFLDSVSFIADEELQRAVWVSGRQGVSSVITLGELYAQFFDDNDLDNFIADDLDTSPLSGEQKKAIRQLRDALNDFSKAPGKMPNAMSDAELVDDPEWKRLVRLARATLTVFSKRPDIPS